MNKVFLVGRLTSAPELKQTATGLSVASFTLAVNRKNNRDEADFVRIVAWRGLADNCAKYLDKGQQAAVMGELHIRLYEDGKGQKHSVTEVVADEIEFLAKPGVKSKPTEQTENFFGGAEVLMDDGELPF